MEEWAEKENIRRLGVITSDVSDSTEIELVPVDQCGSGSCLVLGRMNYDGVFKMDSLWVEHSSTWPFLLLQGCQSKGHCHPVTWMKVFLAPLTNAGYPIPSHPHFHHPPQKRVWLDMQSQQLPSREAQTPVSGFQNLWVP